MPAVILVVDDEPDLETMIRQKFRKKIQANEFQFIFATNGVHALENLRQNPAIDIVLTDINMPEMDGLTLLAKIAELEVLPKAVVVSAYDDMINIRTAMNRGAFDFLTKPIDLQDLEITIERTLRELLNLRQATQARNQLMAIQLELSVASGIQRSILPRVFPPFPHRDDFEIYAEMIPATHVGGDFYDFFLIDDDHLGFLIADVSGKGVPAAILMSMSRALLKATALTQLPTNQCLRDVNRWLCCETDSGMFVTLFYGILNVRTGKLEYSNAGHPSPYILQKSGGIRNIERVQGIAIGLLRDTEYQSGSLDLQPGDALLLYTDGVTDAMDSEENFFSEDRLQKFLQQVNGSPLPQIVQSIAKEVQGFSGTAPQTDDITILALKYLGEGHSSQS